MATTTAVYGFSLPAIASATDENLWGNELNSNTSSLDTILAAKLSSAAPVWTGTGSGVNLNLSGTLSATLTATLSAGVVGTTTNSSATSGIIGEYLSGTAASVSLTSATAKTITSVSLTAGDWDVEGTIQFTFSGASTLVAASISAVTNTLQGSAAPGYSQFTISTTNGVHNIPTGRRRISLASTTTYYLVGQINSAGTLTGDGTIIARRIR